MTNTKLTVSSPKNNRFDAISYETHMFISTILAERYKMSIPNLKLAISDEDISIVLEVLS